MELDYDFMIADLPTVFAGLPNTLLLTAWSLLFAVTLALALGAVILTGVPVLTQAVIALNTFIKGVPLAVQLLFCYYGMPLLCRWLDGLGVYHHNPRHIPYFWAAVAALACNFGAYLTDVVVSSVRAIGHGQIECAHALGMTRWQTIRRVIVPQGAVIALPGFTNYVIWLLKGTALASLINVSELLIAAQLSAADGYEYLEAYIDAALIYWAVCAGLEYAMTKLERRVGAYRRQDVRQTAATSAHGADADDTSSAPPIPSTEPISAVRGATFAHGRAETPTPQPIGA